MSVSALHEALEIVRGNVSTFSVDYPHDHAISGVYPARIPMMGYPKDGGLADSSERPVAPAPHGSNLGWTTGFWPGMLWLAFEATDESFFRTAALSHVASFAQRAEDLVDLDHHDMGFLYTLVATPAWRAARDERALESGLIAANQLLKRVIEPAGIVAAWGALEDPDQQGRAIIDSLMNMPLFYWATQVTGDRAYEAAAIRHVDQLVDHIVRPNGSTYHTFRWDVTTGEPVRGATAQGLSDESTWARGQAWAIYGFAVNHLHTGRPSYLEAAKRCADYFIEHLPADKVAYWDLDFGDGSGEPRDTSAAAIAVNGLIELSRASGVERYAQVADEILDSLVARYATRAGGVENCLLGHGVYYKAANVGVDEGNLWGDYFYLEALVRRAKPDLESHWLPSEKDGGPMSPVEA